MSNVLEFRPAYAGGPAVFPRSGSSAEIVIFPGVRYERAAEPRDPAPAPSHGKKRKSSSGRGGKR